MHEISLRQLRVGVQEPVGGDQVHLRVVRPAGQQRLQHASRGRFAHGDAAGHADDEGHRTVRVLLGLAKELRCRGEQPLAGGDLKVQQSGQRQVDLFDFEHVDLLTETAQPDQFLFGEGQRRRLPQRAPLTSVELHVGARLAQPRHSCQSCSIGPRCSGWGEFSTCGYVCDVKAADLIREYLLLGLRFDRVEPGYVDSYIGDPALHRAVQGEPAPKPDDLAGRPNGCSLRCPTCRTTEGSTSNVRITWPRTCVPSPAPPGSSPDSRSDSSTRCTTTSMCGS